MIDHVGLNVRELAPSRAFYEGALAAIGYTVFREIGAHIGFASPSGKPDFWIARRGEPTTGAHVCFQVETRELVDAFHAAAIEAGGRDNGGPGERPHYHRNYYGAFVLDPDGNNVEAVCHARPG